MSRYLHTWLVRALGPFSSAAVMALGAALVLWADWWLLDLAGLVAVALSAIGLGWLLGHSFAHLFCFAEFAKGVMELARNMIEAALGDQFVGLEMTIDGEDVPAPVPEIRHDA